MSQVVFDINSEASRTKTNIRNMNKTRYPCLELNSEAIKSTALCYASPIIAGKCNAVKAQCVCKVDKVGASKNISKTRHTCVKAICGKNQ